MRTAQRAVELRRDAGASVDVGVKAAQDHKKELTRMFDRLDSFETMLRDHAVGQKGIVTDPLPHSRSAGELVPSSPVGSPKASDEMAEVSPNIEIIDGGVKSEAIQQAVAKVKQKAMLPQQLFMQQPEDYREVDSETWNAQFGVGFRERLAALFLAEVFSTGKTGEQWGRDNVRDHGLMECHPARELVAALSALDAMIMTDRERGLLNRVSVERLARKAYALTRAFRLCHVESDWRRPKGKEGNSWRTKIDWELARRIDSFLAEDAGVNIPSVDEEVRKEMDREASILKARAKLDERNGSSGKKDPELWLGGGHFPPARAAVYVV